MNSHTDKVGHLSKLRRDELGRRLQDGQSGIEIEIVQWLNSQPDVKAVLNEYFGCEINRQLSIPRRYEHRAICTTLKQRQWLAQVARQEQQEIKSISPSPAADAPSLKPNQAKSTPEPASLPSRHPINPPIH